MIAARRVVQQGKIISHSQGRIPRLESVSMCRSVVGSVKMKFFRL